MYSVQSWPVVHLVVIRHPKLTTLSQDTQNILRGTSLYILFQEYNLFFSPQYNTITLIVDAYFHEINMLWLQSKYIVVSLEWDAKNVFNTFLGNRFLNPALDPEILTNLIWIGLIR